MYWLLMLMTACLPQGPPLEVIEVNTNNLFPQTIETKCDALNSQLKLLPLSLIQFAQQILPKNNKNSKAPSSTFPSLKFFERFLNTLLVWCSTFSKKIKIAIPPHFMESLFLCWSWL